MDVSSHTCCLPELLDHRYGFVGVNYEVVTHLQQLLQVITLGYGVIEVVISLLYHSHDGMPQSLCQTCEFHVFLLGSPHILAQYFSTPWINPLLHGFSQEHALVYGPLVNHTRHLGKVVSSILRGHSTFSLFHQLGAILGGLLDFLVVLFEHTVLAHSFVFSHGFHPFICEAPYIYNQESSSFVSFGE